MDRSKTHSLRLQHQRLITARFEAFVEANLGIHPARRVGDKIGTSARSLSAACRECLGISPKQYVLRRHLDLARQALQADNCRLVIEVATRFGFFELSRFSTKYRKYTANCRRRHYIEGAATQPRPGNATAGWSVGPMPRLLGRALVMPDVAVGQQSSRPAAVARASPRSVCSQIDLSGITKAGIRR
jgi:AraC-like DNA-binding protein